MLCIQIFTHRSAKWGLLFKEVISPKALQGSSSLFSELTHNGKEGQNENSRVYFILSSEFNAYLKQIKWIMSAVKIYRIFSLVTNTIYIFSL